MRRFGNLTTLASLLVLFSLLVAACGGTSGGTSTPGTTKTTKKVVLVTDTGGLNDQGFNQLAYKGYKQAVAEFGFPEKVIQTQSANDYVQNLTAAAQQGDLVVAVGFKMDAAIYQIAKQFPAKKFAIVDGCATPPNSFDCENLPNVAPLAFKEQEAGCLVGAVAGQMELDGPSKISKLKGKSTIAAVGGEQIPPVDRFIAGYKYCALKVNPSVDVKIVYSQDFNSTAKCSDAATSLINQYSADIIFQVAGGCGVGALDAADQKGVFGIGVDSDQGYIHSSVITSALKRVDTSVYSTAKDFINDKYVNNPPVFNLAVDGVGYATVSKDVPADAKQKADDFAAQIKAGTLTPPEKIP
jgi:basic membrane protein A